MPGNELVVDHERVSRKHARIERRGENFVLRDLGSTNGTWIGENRVDEHFLANGDTFSVGPAQVVFKSGFVAQDLTMVDEAPSGKKAARRPVVFVPGLMGSELWLGSERIWPNVKYLFKNPEIYRLDENTPIEPRGVLGEVVIVPNLIKLEGYNRLGDYLVQEMGYTRGVDLLEFSYDWRKDVRLASQKLAQAIAEWDVKRPITIIAHSLGTLVSRYYVERLGGKSVVERLLLLGGPHNGVPKAATSLLLGPNLLPFGLLGERLRHILATFPTSYQILPTYPCAIDQTGQPVNMLEDESWLTPVQVPLLRNAREFRQELGTRSSIPAVSIFGYGLKTVTRIFTQRDARGAWRNVTFEIEPGGDATIPEGSAVLGGTEIHPVQQYHGTLYIDNDVKMRLKLELTR
jgi:pimeloyl-ACP methyl ester carboxylesterase